VTVIANSAISTGGANAAGILAQSVGGGGGNGGSSASSAAQCKVSLALALGGSGGTGANSSAVAVHQIGSVSTQGANSPGIFAQSIGGGGGNGGSSTSSSSSGGSVNATLALGGRGSGGGNADYIYVDTLVSSYNRVAGTNLPNPTTAAGIWTNGVNSQGIFAQSVGGGGGNGGSSSVMNDTGNNSGNATSMGLTLGGSSGNGGNASNVNINNTTNITTSGIGSQAILLQSVGGGGGNGGVASSAASGVDATVSLALGAAGGNGGNARNIGINSSSYLTTYKANSSALVAQSVGGGGGNAGASSNNTLGAASSLVSSLLGASGGVGGKGSYVEINTNGGAIQTSGLNAMGIVAQSIGGGGGEAASTTSAIAATFGLGASGGAGGNADFVSVINASPISTGGNNAVGILAQSIGGGGGLGTSTLTVAEGHSLDYQFNLGGGKSASSITTGDGQAVTVSNSGSVNTKGANAVGVLAQSIGGGGGFVASTLSGGSINVKPSVIGAQAGSSGNGANVTVSQSGAVLTNGAGAIGIVAQSVGGGGGYLGITSNDPNASLNNGSNISIGAAGGAQGNGGIVTVTNTGTITTTGKNAVAILAQSVGGGGGVLVTSGLGTVTPTYGTGDGYGSNVTVNVNAAIQATGVGGYGVLAQSVGGGGGLVMTGNSITDGGGKGKGYGGVVTVNVNAPIVVSGQKASGVYAKTISGSADPFVTVAAGQYVFARDGASAIVLDGMNNQLINNGIVAVANATTDTALETRGGGVTLVQNSGNLIGNVLAAAGDTINFNNLKGGTVLASNTLNVGATGSFTNDGYLLSQASDAQSVSSSTFTGNFTQSANGVLGIKFDLQSKLSDHFTLANVGTHVLAGKIKPVLVNKGAITPGASQAEFLSVDAGTVTYDKPELDFKSAIVDFSIQKASGAMALSAVTEFAPAGMSAFATQIGQALGTYQSQGSNAFFKAATAQLVGVPTVAELDLAYAALAGTAITSAPKVVYQAANYSLNSYTERISDWRNGQSFAGRTSQSINFVTGQGAQGVQRASTSVDALETMPTDTRSRSWGSISQRNSSGGALKNNLIGGTIGFEADLSRGNMVGVGVTLSQSNYTHSDSASPSTPGDSLSLGLSGYGVTKIGDAYVSGVAYLGGSDTNYRRQLQVFDPAVASNLHVRSAVVGGRLEAGYAFHLNKVGTDSSRITLFAAIQPVSISQDGAYENVDNLGRGFYYAKKNYSAVPVYVGFEYFGTFHNENGGTVTPFVRVSRMWGGGKASSMNALLDANQGMSLSYEGSPNLGDAMLYRAGVKFNFGKNTTGYLNVNYEQGINASYQSMGATFGLNYAL
jgi:hypothetical protein